jgi:tetratricopeptide (TPR) repeat protein/predicted aspartyl protease
MVRVNSITNPGISSQLCACVRFGIGALAILGLSSPPMAAFAACKLGKMAELPVTMSNSKPLITAKINGEDARFIADSGAFFSMITEASAAEFKLKLSPAPFGLFVRGLGGSVNSSIATVKVFTFAGIPIHNVQFLVGGSTVGSENVGLLGQNFFRIGDVEYDLAKGTIRLMHAEGCGHALLAYWVKPSDPFSVMDIEWATPQSPHTTGTALINGARIRVMFDTGAGASILSLKAAERAGVKPDSEGVVEAGYWRGIGRGTAKTYIGRFSSFKIGDEEIRQTRLRFGDFGIDAVDMLIGPDFFLSHRIYVASSQHKLYFTYNGGPVFNLTASPSKAPAEPTADASPEDKKRDDEPSNAAAYSQRGTAFAARRDYEHAIADLTHACELEPKEPEYFYQRGVVYRDNKQIDLAAADFDRALELKSDDLPALEARALLRLRARDIVGARSDLDSADRTAPKEADLRFFLARGYQSADLLPASIAQYDLWILAHAADSRMPEALSGRCWARALQGQELAQALSDCNAALKLSAKSSPTYARILNGRGLVRLRLGDYDKSIADYDASLQIVPKDAWSVYGRGIDKLRKKRTPEGEADIAYAKKLWPKVADEFTRRGITP